VSPLVARLVHESQEDTGGLYEVAAVLRQAALGALDGKTFRLGRSIAIEDVDAAMADITPVRQDDASGGDPAALQPLIENVEAGRARAAISSSMSTQRSAQFPEYQSSYDERDVALYALAWAAKDRPTSASCSCV